MKCHLDDTFYYALSTAFTTSPGTVSAHKGGRPEASLVSDDEKCEVEDNHNVQEETDFWHKSKKLDNPKFATSTKDKDTKAPVSEPHQPQ